MPAQLPWHTHKPSSSDKQEKPDSLTVDINVDTPGGDGNSTRTHSSPFAPHVGGAITRRGSGAISTRISGMPPGIFTPLGSATGDGQHQIPSGKRSTRKEQREMERRAAPEKDLTLFAMRLAVLEKVASTVGTLGFIWATVVLLGGYAITLKEIDFWFVTVILVIEGARIFSRSHELEWQHQDAGTAAGSFFSRGSNALFRSTRKIISTLTRERDGNSKLQVPESSEILPHKVEFHLKRTWSASRVPIVPALDWMFSATHISRLLYWMQLLAACVATALSLYRLCTRNFTRPSETDTGQNHTAALLIFYSLATFEALVFLLERTYWQFQISVKKILVRVNQMCGLETRDLTTTRRFFYDVYSKCLTESVFDGLKMDMVDYALNWLQSDVPGEQMGGLRVLLTFSSREEFCEETLRSMGVKQGAVERLLEMVTWKNPSEHEVRKAAADLLSKLVKYNSYSMRVVAISGSIEGIFSLLAREDDDDGNAAEYTRQGASEFIAPKNVEKHIVGLRILKNLAKDPLNCARIGITRGLLPRLISFIDTNHSMLRNAEEPEHKISIVKKSLELLNLLSGASAASGKMLREEIAKIVYTITNLRKILEYGQAHMMLQELAAEILCSLAMDDDVRDIIGRTGGLMRNLLALLMKERVEGDNGQLQVSVRSGEALALLALKSRQNCLKMMRLKVRQGGVVVAMEEEEDKDHEATAGGEVEGSTERDVVAALMEKVADWEIGHLAMNILRSFCAYSEDERCKARIASSCTKRVFKLVAERTGIAQEAALGLLAQTVQVLGQEELARMLTEEGLSAEGLASRLAKMLGRHLHGPVSALPRLRRFGVELAMGLAEHHRAAFGPAFREVRFRPLLQGLADSVSEIENYATFFGVTGVTLHSLTMSRLVDIAIDKFR